MLEKLPIGLLSKLRLIYTKEELGIIETGFIKEKPTTFRVNTLKTNNQEIEKILKGKGLEIQRIPFLENGYKLLNGKEKDLWDLDIFKNGFIYLQSISSQLPVHFMNLKKGNRVFDVTAAPGGKTTQISAMLENTGEITALDNNKIRIDKLKFNIKRQGASNIKTFKLDARVFDKDKYDGYFDNILFDAPCSSEGRINLDKEKTYNFWNEGIPKRNYKLQKSILRNIVSMLRSGGELIYSTCTLSPEENEAVVHFLLSNFKELEIVDITEILEIKNSKSGITKFGDIVYRNDVSKSLRILPSEDMEGFFVAKFLRK